MEIVLTDECFHFETDELDDNVIAHKSLFVLACKLPWLASLLLGLASAPCHRCIALFLPLSCICFSMPSASGIYASGDETFGLGLAQCLFSQGLGVGERK